MNIKEATEILNRIDIKFFLSGMIEQNNYIVDKADEVNTAIYTVLNELDKNTETINDLINEVTIKDAELEKKDKVIDMMAEYIEEWTGSCPNDMYDWKEIDCDKECEISMRKCWIKYFYKLVEGNIDKK